MRSELPPALRPAEPIPLADRILLSMNDMSALIGVSEPIVRDLVRKGMPTIRIGTRVLFRRQSVEAWLALRESSTIDAGSDEPTGDQP